MAHIDWLAIYNHFISSDTITLVECSKKFGINLDYVRQKSAKEGWVTKKLQVRQNSLALIEKRTANEIAKRNEAHIKQARLLQATALESIAEKGLRPETFDVARKALEVGQKLERTALGMDKVSTPNIELANSKGQLLRIFWGDNTPLGDFVQNNDHIELVKSYDSY
jgi:hypothetical protein